MAGGTAPQILRVVVLSRQVWPCAALAGEGFAAARVDTAYEAAAEILKDPPAALVIDLHCLPARHQRLLEIAMHMGVPAVTFGPALPSMPADILAGAKHVQ